MECSVDLRSAWLFACLRGCAPPLHPVAEHFETHRNIFVHGRPGLSVDDLTADPDFDWVAKWTQVVPQLAQAFNFVMMATVRAVYQSQLEQGAPFDIWVTVGCCNFAFCVSSWPALLCAAWQGCVGLLSWVCYTTVGLAYMPIDILKGQGHVDRLQATIEEREALLGNRYAQIREKAWRQGVGSLSRRERRDAEVSEQSRCASLYRIRVGSLSHNDLTSADST